MFDVCCLQGVLCSLRRISRFLTHRIAGLVILLQKTLKIQLMGQSESLVHGAEIPLCHCRTEMTGLMD